jgi:hypothetical protein
MAGFIVLDDGRGIAPASWAYDAVVLSVIEDLSHSEEERQLAAWLQERLCEVCGSVLGYVDVRELTPANQKLFRHAAERALARQQREGPVGWSDPSFFPAWLSRFERLIQMWQSIDRGEAPSALNDLRSATEPSGKKSGPGWQGCRTKRCS